jgi:hypothetical protein
MAKAKGTTMVTLVKVLRSQRERALVALPPSLHGYLDERIHASSWYPEADMLALLRVMLGMVPGSRDAVLLQIGSALAREHLEGIYGHLKLDTRDDPATMARRCFALWASQHDTGVFHFELVAPGDAKLEVRDYAFPSVEMCRILSGYLAESLRVGGAASVTVAKSACRLDGAPVCAWTVAWEG